MIINIINLSLITWHVNKNNSHCYLSPGSNRTTEGTSRANQARAPTLIDSPFGFLVNTIAIAVKRHQKTTLNSAKLEATKFCELLP